MNVDREETHIINYNTIIIDIQPVAKTTSAIYRSVKQPVATYEPLLPSPLAPYTLPLVGFCQTTTQTPGYTAMRNHIRDEWPAYGGNLSVEVWQRIRAAMRHEEGDRVPIWDYIDNRAVVEHFTQPGDTFDEMMVRVYHGLGIDLCRGYGAAFDEEDERTTGEDGDWQVSGHTRWATKRAISSYEELRTYEPRILTEDDADRWLEHSLANQKRLAPHSYFVPGAGCGFHEVYDLMGQAMFSYAIYDERKELDRLFEAYRHNSTLIAKRAAREKIGPLFFTWADIAYKKALLFSPDFLRETFIPMLAAVCEPLKEAGLTVIFHSDGDLTEIVDDMIDAGIDGLNPIEPMAGMDIGLMKRRYGDRLILVGNMDCSQLLPLGTPAEIVEGTKQILRDAGHGGGLFIGSSSEIVPATPLENVLAFFKACREWGQYPLQV